MRLLLIGILVAFLGFAGNVPAQAATDLSYTAENGEAVVPGPARAAINAALAAHRTSEAMESAFAAIMAQYELSVIDIAQVVAVDADDEQAVLAAAALANLDRNLGARIAEIIGAAHPDVRAEISIAVATALGVIPDTGEISGDSLDLISDAAENHCQTASPQCM